MFRTQISVRSKKDCKFFSIGANSIQAHARVSYPQPAIKKLVAAPAQNLIGRGGVPRPEVLPHLAHSFHLASVIDNQLGLI
jgi:hypothetical protein